METLDRLQSFVQFWKDFNLESRRETYQKTNAEIMEAQKQSLQRRRELTEETHEFRKNTDPKVVEAAKGLLKKYQQEIDR